MRDDRSLREPQWTIPAVVLALDSDLLIRLVDHKELDLHASSQTLWVNLGHRHKITRSINLGWSKDHRKPLVAVFSLEGVMDPQQFLSLFKEALARIFPPQIF